MKKIGKARVLMILTGMGAATLLVTCVTTTPVQNPQQFPTPGAVWLSRTCPSTMNSCLQSAANDTEVEAYYAAIGARPTKDTLDKWKNLNGFDAGGDVKAIYFNNADLAIGREMHCKQNNANIACYVTNYGPPPFANGAQNPGWPNSTQALADAVAGNNPFATVAMEFSPNNSVLFYVYDGKGALTDDAALDGQGPKSVPEMCMSCHGGAYDTGTHLPSGSSFLPFDLSKFLYSSQNGYTKPNQEEVFRQLNALVLSTNPNQGNSDNPIGTLINGWYHGNVNTPGTTADESFVPQGWIHPTGNGTENQDANNLYVGMVKNSCLTCHMAAPQGLDWITYGQFKNYVTINTIQTDVCQNHEMPHAEIPYLYLQNNVLVLAAFQDYLNYLKNQGSNILTC